MGGGQSKLGSCCPDALVSSLGPASDARGHKGRLCIATTPYGQSQVILLRAGVSHWLLRPTALPALACCPATAELSQALRQALRSSGVSSLQGQSILRSAPCSLARCI